MDDVLDLDALKPEAKRIKFEDKIIEVKPPKTGDLLRLSQIGAKLKDAAELTAEQIDDITGKLEAQIKALVPELGETNLATGQLMALLTLIMEMGMPQQMEELKKQGIEVGEPSKKA